MVTFIDLRSVTVANHKDAIKRNKQNEKRRMRNRHYRTIMRNQVKLLDAAIEAGDVAAAEAQLNKTVSIIQRVNQKGIIHRRQAARRVSRLYKAVNKLKAA